MDYDISADNIEQILRNTLRNGKDLHQETSILASAGETAIWVIKVVNKYDYNIYNVQPVVAGDAGTEPTETANPTLAINIAESFLQQGQLSAGVYSIMLRVGDKNVFYSPI